jgi:hypothetical protein
MAVQVFQNQQALLCLTFSVLLAAAFCVACCCCCSPCSEAEVLSLFAAIVRKLKGLMEPEVPKVRQGGRWKEGGLCSGGDCRCGASAAVCLL